MEAEAVAKGDLLVVLLAPNSVEGGESLKCLSANNQIKRGG